MSLSTSIIIKGINLIETRRAILAQNLINNPPATAAQALKLNMELFLGGMTIFSFAQIARQEMLDAERTARTVDIIRY